MKRRTPKPAGTASQEALAAHRVGTDATPNATSRNKGPEALTVTLVLPVSLDNGNDGRTKHFGAAAKRRREYEATIRLFHPRPVPVQTPARIHVTRVLGPRQRLFDADSLLRGNAKELIDAIVAAGFLPDDGPAHVLEVTASQDKSRRGEGPAVEITIETIQEEPHD